MSKGKLLHRGKVTVEKDFDLEGTGTIITPGGGWGIEAGGIIITKKDWPVIMTVWPEI